uniref:Reverse transcriptase domain-containing protein n=1 Tax=Chromera velia CCMP2878 TaxID=1169474 RepID=A0A0G4HGF3_9ALVE|eukprot:Cvel_1007.t1-p1 / transcript=Cvel_1007.t1 / gene=Cvel_1007 / organism=Chromera_velia_CCMP2878 / gene_product=hypothetical protein / transcript_product=hypothetical protein / location=Cvel_scaffold33:6704-7246(-) / protein_length=181 / sequence_SO=supercontig / SO=protein_coding / is_pseudo=false
MSKKAGRSAFKISITDLKFADDLAASEMRERRMQEFADRLQAACNRWGLKISIKKTKMMVQPGRGEGRHIGELRQSTIAIKGQPLQEVEQFWYLGDVSQQRDPSPHSESRDGVGEVAGGGMEAGRAHNKDKNAYVQRCSPPHPPLWGRDVGSLKRPNREVGVIVYGVCEAGDEPASSGAYF